MENLVENLKFSHLSVLFRGDFSLKEIFLASDGTKNQTKILLSFCV